MRKTKIVGTLGPASNDKNTIKSLVEAGLDVVRLNLSHGNYKDHGNLIDLVREVEDDIGKTVGIMLDTKGPEVRIGPLENDNVNLNKDDEICFTTEEIIGTKDKVSISYKNICEDIEEGSKILVDDGLIELKVIEVTEKEFKCKVINGGILGSRKGVNIPGISLNLPVLTESDMEYIKFGIDMDINFIAASFIRKAQDVIKIRNFLEKEGAEGIYIIAKVENQEGVDNIDEIIKVADGIMIARGDLGVEIPPEQVPVIQKRLIRKCNEAAKPVITATQMLDSMIRNPRPTRAEASDVANAIIDGTDAIMLSGESAVGKFPLESVITMDNIALEIENSSFYQELIYKSMKKYKCQSTTVTEAISFSSCEVAFDIKSKCIICVTTSGTTARMVSKYRPNTEIIAVTNDKFVKHFLTICWGVYPLQCFAKITNTDEMIDSSISTVKNYGLLEKEDIVVVTAGLPVSMSGKTNFIEVLEV
ncbi:pyruvate kinase [Natronospora cellulosivora (SeqCode)]